MADQESLFAIIEKFCTERDWDQFHGPKDLAIGASTEAAELLELFRFRSDAEIRTKMNDPEFKEKVADELADVYFFLLRFSQLHRFDLNSSLLKKMEKNAKKYPVERAKGSNRKYNE